MAAAGLRVRRRIAPSAGLPLNDMGESLADAATYYGGSTSPTDVGNPADARSGPCNPGRAVVIGEWRTPPLWGVADSAPYLHDGRARTLHEAIRLHGGEAEQTAARTPARAAATRIALFHFLHSLTSSPGDGGAAAIDAIQARSHHGTPPTRRE